jgi:hypothetical protein
MSTQRAAGRNEIVLQATVIGSRVNSIRQKSSVPEAIKRDGINIGRAARILAARAIGGDQTAGGICI